MQTNSPHKSDTSKNFIFSPFQKQFQLPLNKTNRIPKFHLFLLLFVTYWQRQLKQRVNRKHTQQKLRENRELREHKTIQLYRK